ncbi:MAG TPA: RNA-binding protein [Bacteroidales bacterium]|jgi:ribosome-associated protein|nr:RNA-binding protein [Bacteroidales bacterium]
MEKEFVLQGEYIELYKLLKVMNIAATGGHGKILIEEGEVFLNGKQELRKRAKIRQGDSVAYEDITIKVR